MDIKYYNDIDRWGGCDCPMPSHTLVNNPRLGRATVIFDCCIAVKLGGGTPTFNGTPLTEFVTFYDFTHLRASGSEPERAVADNPWDEDEDVIVEGAVSETYKRYTEDILEVFEGKVVLDERGDPIVIHHAGAYMLTKSGKQVIDQPYVPPVTRKKGPPKQAWLRQRLEAKGLYKAAP